MFLAPQAFIDAGVPHVCCVKIDAKLHDTHAVNFSRHLYLALGKGFSINVSISYLNPFCFVLLFVVVAAAVSFFVVAYLHYLSAFKTLACPTQHLNIVLE